MKTGDSNPFFDLFFDSSRVSRETLRQFSFSLVDVQYIATLSSSRSLFCLNLLLSQVIAMTAKTPKLFNKWNFDTLAVGDVSLGDHISKTAAYVPHSSGRWQKKRFHKARIPIIERLTNGLMFKGRGNGKKLQAVRLVKHTLEIINLLTDQNPIQVVVDAVSKAGPREDSTRVGSGGVVRRQAVDVSPMRRVNEAIYLMCKGARESAFRNLKTFPECLADELVNAAKGSSNSYAIKKKDEVERVAKANR